ncbi:MAG TPA: DUF6677 family protein [Gemmataceae bacterium]|jgi:hypothetical protein|nr:DUF6677 family protein [Gemmataceae bacterium]
MASPKSNYSLRAGVLSYLVPGLGQIYEGRVGKGILFMVCLYGLFFYGMYLGDWKNVHLPNSAAVNPPPVNMPKLLANIYNRPQFAGQFWIGIAAWPAIWQYNNLPVPSEESHPFWHDFQRTPSEKTLNELQAEGDKTWDLAWVYTVIAGALNVLVIYDAVAGPALGIEMESRRPLQEAAA